MKGKKNFFFLKLLNGIEEESDFVVGKRFLVRNHLVQKMAVS
jgi:hypothetical protein